MNISICIDIMYPGLSFAEKAAAVRAAGFDTIEFWGWAGRDLCEVSRVTKELDMKISCMCVDSADGQLQQKMGHCLLNAADPDDFCKMLKESIAVAEKLGVRELIATVGENIEGVSYAEQLARVDATLKTAKPILEAAKVILLVEPINRQERPAYLTPNAKTVVDIVRRADSSYIRVLYDIYHQAMERDFYLPELLEALPYIGHLHIEDVPGRHEPGTGTAGYGDVFRALRQVDCSCWLGMEFIPQLSEQKALAVLKQLL